MSGHSKWSKVKHQKAVTDTVKGREFTKASRAVTMAVREGGGAIDPEKNFKLRLAIDKARSVNMPKDNIDRAILRAREKSTKEMERITYEGYGPYGVAVLIETTTDNRNRTASTIKNVFDRIGGTLASPGAVQHLFDRVGVIVIDKKHQSFDSLVDMAIKVGADDICDGGDVYVLYTPPEALFFIKKQVEALGLPVIHGEFSLRAKTLMPLDEKKRKQVRECIELMSELEDVQSVYDNGD